MFWDNNERTNERIDRSIDNQVAIVHCSKPKSALLDISMHAHLRRTTATRRRRKATRTAALIGLLPCCWALVSSDRFDERAVWAERLWVCIPMFVRSLDRSVYIYIFSKTSMTRRRKEKVGYTLCHRWRRSWWRKRERERGKKELIGRCLTSCSNRTHIMPWLRYERAREKKKNQKQTNRFIQLSGSTR